MWKSPGKFGTNGSDIDAYDPSAPRADDGDDATAYNRPKPVIGLIPYSMHSVTKFAGLLLLASIALMTYSFAGSVYLRENATELAEGKAFCVQVPSRSNIWGRDDIEYRSVRTFGDTWGMIGSGGFHHAALIIGDPTDPRTFHWSYFKRKFVEGTYGPFPIVCQPALRFFEQNLKEDHDKSKFTLAGRAMAIPRKYHPKPEWPGNLVGYSIRASAPLFEPFNESCVAIHCPWVWVAFEKEGKPYGFDQVRRGQAVPYGPKFHGLTQVGDRSRYGEYDKYVEISPENTVRTAISCIQDCSHEFSSNGLTFRFRHPPAELPHWREMQKRLVALHVQFASIPAKGVAIDKR